MLELALAVIGPTAGCQEGARRGKSHRSRVAARRARRRAAGVLGWVLLATAACGTTGAATGSGRDPITRAQIQELADGTGTALSVVRQLRPSWLRARNPGRPSTGGLPIYPAVFLDQLRLGPIESLDDVSSQIIQRIELLDMRDATILFGEGYPAGVIRVVTVPPGEGP